MKKILTLQASSLCFISGDIFSMGFYLLFGDAFTHFMLKAFGTLIIGVLGGVAGLAGKDLYPIIKSYIKKKFCNKKKAK